MNCILWCEQKHRQICQNKDHWKIGRRENLLDRIKNISGNTNPKNTIKCFKPVKQQKIQNICINIKTHTVLKL